MPQDAHEDAARDIDAYLKQERRRRAWLFKAIAGNDPDRREVARHILVTGIRAILSRYAIDYDAQAAALPHQTPRVGGDKSNT